MLFDHTALKIVIKTIPKFPLKNSMQTLGAGRLSGGTFPRFLELLEEVPPLLCVHTARPKDD